VKNGEKILRLIRELEHKRNLRNELFEMESIRDTYSIILGIIRASSADKYVPSVKYGKLQPAIDYILQNYNKNITNDTLASVSGISTVYFRKLFSEIMGVSPITYVKSLRIEKAKELLKSDYGNLTDIAYSLGYSSLYDFSRDFKKHTGTAPSKYRS
jgi:AraC-like DNA-binding protein